MIASSLAASLPRRKAATLVAITALAFPAAYGQSQRSVGDFLATAVPLATLGTELYRGDREGAWQYGLTFATAAASTELLKKTTHVERPDGTNDLSFPSGHASAAFSAAAYVRQRHGLQAASPLYLTALYVGHTRVAAKRHRWADIAGSALVCELAAGWLVRRAPDSAVVMSATVGRRHIGASIAATW
jgi:membrane-associated phospholipid phosphatase